MRYLAKTLGGRGVASSPDRDISQILAPWGNLIFEIFAKQSNDLCMQQLQCVMKTNINLFQR